MWALVTRGADAPPPADMAEARRWCARLAGLASPVLAAHLLADASAALGEALVDPTAVEESRLLARFRLQHQRRWAAAIAAQGIETVCLRGIAAGITVFGDAALRAQGDMDLLVREADLRALVSFLAGQGFRFFRPPVHRWGMISDASFLPFVSPDGECDIDIHVLPDCYPAHLSLTTDRVFAAARRIDGEGGGLLAPSSSHAMALCVTNAAKDKFDLFALRKVIDAAAMLRGRQPLDWDEILGLARDGRYLKPARAFFCLLRRLGAPVGAVPPALLRPPAWPARPVFERVARDFRDLFATRPSMAELWWREITLCAEPRVALHNAGLRLRGLVRPHEGLPAGLPASALPRAE
jgi:hypothetical protein